MVPATRRKLLRGLALAFCATLVADQLVQWTLLRGGSFLGRRIAPYAPALFDDVQRSKLEALRLRLDPPQAPGPELDFDAELGWCRPPRDVRPAAQAPPQRTRVVAVGDSFVFGYEVEAQECWLAALGRARADLELLDLGVESYDLEQSLLRWRRDGVALAPRELWVGFVPSQVLRNVTSYIPAWRHWTPFPSFKPRAELAADGALRHVPSPARSLREMVELLDDPARFLERLAPHDRWVGACPAAYAPFGSSVLHLSAATRLFLTLAERGGREPWIELEKPRSEVLELFSAQFRELHADGIRVRILVLPDRDDLSWLRTHGSGYWQSMCARLEREGHELFDASSGLVAAGADLDPLAWAQGGHYSASGNARVAQLLDAWLRAHP